MEELHNASQNMAERLYYFKTRTQWHIYIPVYVHRREGFHHRKIVFETNEFLFRDEPVAIMVVRFEYRLYEKE